MKICLYSGLLNRLSCVFLIVSLFLTPCSLIASEESDQDISDAASEEGDQDIFDETTFIIEEIQNILDTTIITASRTGTTLGKSTRSIGLVTRQDMMESQNYYVPEMAENVPGVTFIRNGGPGQIGLITIRGVSDDYTQMQYNSIPLKDPSDFDGGLYYTFTNFYASLNIENIEVLKGTNSTLYGSQAVGGVINIASEKWINGFKYEDRMELGEYSTFIKQNRAAYGNRDYYVDISTHLIDTDGDDNGGENDFYYKNRGFFANFGRRFGNDISLEFHSIYYDTEVPGTSSTGLDEDAEPVPTYAAKTKYRDNRLLQTALVLNHNVSPLWDYIVRAAYTESESNRTYSNISYVTENSGESTYFEIQNNFYLSEWLMLVVGGSYEKNEKTRMILSFGKIEETNYDLKNKDIFGLAKTVFFNDTLFIDAGIRYSDPDIFDSQESWEISGAYVFNRTGTKFHGHVGTGFVMPSLTDAYNNSGEFNSQLGPEKALSYDIGIEQYIMKNKIRFGANWFNVRFDDLIGINNFQLENVDEARSEGIEGFLSMMPCKYFRLSAAYTYTKAEKKNRDGEWVNDRSKTLPKNKINVTASFYPMDRLTANFGFVWMDEIELENLSGSDGVVYVEDNPVIVDMALTYKMFDNIDIWFRVENLFDEDYTSMAYTMPGRWIYGGLKLSF
ncbi:MAG: TonB-dependent receptor [Desulfobacterales bacterium]|nr:TonB-dependent receptor [Desulfobacterales bacterium]